MPQFFAHIEYRYGGGWGISRESIAEALRIAGRQVAIGTARERNRHPHYVIVFPDDAKITVYDDSYGTWTSTHSPYEVAVRHRIPPDVNLLGTKPLVVVTNG